MKRVTTPPPQAPIRRLNRVVVLRVAALAVCLLAAGCSGGGNTPPEASPNVDKACTQQNDCLGGTSCLPRAHWNSLPDAGVGCTASTLACSVTCAVDGDCALFGLGLKCQEGCNGGKSTCVPAQ